MALTEVLENRFVLVLQVALGQFVEAIVVPKNEVVGGLSREGFLGEGVDDSLVTEPHQEVELLDNGSSGQKRHVGDDHQVVLGSFGELRTKSAKPENISVLLICLTKKLTDNAVFPGTKRCHPLC